MDVKTFYATIGGDYEEILGRFMTEERILRFVRKFSVSDNGYRLLKDSLANGNCEEAFRGAHTLKGVAQNLSFTALYKQAEVVTNVLRGGSMEVAHLMPALDEIYERTVSAIAQIDA